MKMFGFGSHNDDEDEDGIPEGVMGAMADAMKKAMMEQNKIPFLSSRMLAAAGHLARNAFLRTINGGEGFGPGVDVAAFSHDNLRQGAQNMVAYSRSRAAMDDLILPTHMDVNVSVGQIVAESIIAGHDEYMQSECCDLVENPVCIRKAIENFGINLVMMLLNTNEIPALPQPPDFEDDTSATSLAFEGVQGRYLALWDLGYWTLSPSDDTRPTPEAFHEWAREHAYPLMAQVYGDLPELWTYDFGAWMSEQGRAPTQQLRSELDGALSKLQGTVSVEDLFNS